MWSSHFFLCHLPWSIDLSSYQCTCQTAWFSECRVYYCSSKYWRNGDTAHSTAENINFLQQRHHGFMCPTSPRHRQPSRHCGQCWKSESLLYTCPWKLEAPSKCFCLHLRAMVWYLSPGPGSPKETSQSPSLGLADLPNIQKCSRGVGEWSKARLLTHRLWTLRYSKQWHCVHRTPMQKLRKCERKFLCTHHLDIQQTQPG